MPYTETYCDPSTGSNSNGGSDAGSPSFTSAIGVWDGTSVYTTASTTGVTVGQFANIGGGYVARVVSIITSTSFTVSTTAKFGTLPGAGVLTSKVGGAWKGPNGADNWPFGSITPALTNASGNPIRVNLKNNATYTVSAGIVATWSSPNGFVTFQGYSSAVDDGGKAIIDGAGGTFDVITFTGSPTIREIVIRDLIVKNSTGTGVGIKLIGTTVETQLIRVVATGMSSHGFSLAGAVLATFVECEAYLNGGSGFSANGVFDYCVSHSNTSHGFIQTDQSAIRIIYKNCIAHLNGGNGFISSDGSGISLLQSDSYNNTGDGVRIQTTAGFPYAATIQNCNFVQNGGYGINQAGTGILIGYMANCGFGTGFAANTSGKTNLAASSVLHETGTVNYFSNTIPWANAATGDFRITSNEAKGAGRGAFTETAPGYTGTVAYPDIGQQHKDSVPTNVGIRSGGRM